MGCFISLPSHRVWYLHNKGERRIQGDNRRIHLLCMTLLVLLDVFRRCDNLSKTRFPPVEKQRVLYSATRFRRFFRPLTKYQRTFNPTTKPQHRKHSVGRLTGPRLLLLLLEEKQDPLGHPSTSTFTAVVGFERNCINTLIIYSPSPQKKKKKNL